MNKMTFPTGPTYYFEIPDEPTTGVFVEINLGNRKNYALFNSANASLDSLNFKEWLWQDQGKANGKILHDFMASACNNFPCCAGIPDKVEIYQDSGLFLVKNDTRLEFIKIENVLVGMISMPCPFFYGRGI